MLQCNQYGKVWSVMNPAIDFSAPISHAPLPRPIRERFGQVPRPATGRGEPVHTRDGRELHLRPIEPDDLDALRRCFTRLSPEEIRRRFLHAMAELPMPMAQRLCNIDPQQESAYVLIDESVQPAEMRGVGRIYVDEVTRSAEFSVLVEQSWSRRGLGALLMRHLVEDCRRRGLDELWGFVLLENRPMLQLCQELGFTQKALADEPGTARLRLML